jgi:hypothetical protein
MFANLSIKKETILIKYESLSPQKRAMIDMVKIILGASTIGAIVAVVVNYGLWFYLGLVICTVGVIGMLKTLYEMRVFHHTIQDQFKK